MGTGRNPVKSLQRGDPRSVAAVKRRLLAWYREHRRDLPWRSTRDPYRIVLSEFMLQQTQVDTVIPYYERFLQRFPTVESLARASQPDVLKAWEGLGYYSRARNLHAAASDIVGRFRGRVPDTYDALSSLSGFGPYTTAAVLSIAFDKDHAVLDGNVIRVLARLYAVSDDVRRTPVRDALRGRGQTLLGRGDAGDFNQAMMELGATVCTPRAPACASCPIRRYCAAADRGRPEDFPSKGAKKARPHHTMAVAIVERDTRLLIARRPENGLLGGLWEFPAERQAKGESLQACCLRAAFGKTGVTADVASRFRTVKHAFTHFTVTMHAFLCSYAEGTARPIGCAQVAWAALSELDDYAFSRANRRLVDHLRDGDNGLFT